MSAGAKFTITLGRSGEIVKRARSMSDGIQSDDDMPSYGGKRPVREMMESNMTHSNSYSSQYESKRQRTGGHDSRFIDKNLKDTQIKSKPQVGREDLRWKLLKKSTSQKINHAAEEQHDVDLRERLSRSRHASNRSEATSRSDARQHEIESSASGFGRRMPSRRCANDMHELDSQKRVYSLTFERQRRNSPERLINAPRHISPSRRYGELHNSPVMRSLDTSRPSFLTIGGVGDDISRTHTFMSKNTSVGSTKPVVRAPAPLTTAQRSVFNPEEPLTVATLLQSLGLGKYAVLFQAEEVDMAALRQMGDNDLKEMGIPMGPRKKILLAVFAHTRQRQRQRGQ